MCPLMRLPWRAADGQSVPVPHQVHVRRRRGVPNRQISARLEEVKLDAIADIVYKGGRQWGFGAIRAPHKAGEHAISCDPNCAQGELVDIGQIVTMSGSFAGALLLASRL